MRRPEGFDERPDRPAAPSSEPAGVRPERQARRFGLRIGRRDPQVAEDDGLEALLAASAPAPVDGSAGPGAGLPELPDVDGPDPDDDTDARTAADDADGRSAAAVPRGRAGTFAGTAGRRLGAGLSSGFSSVAERLRELSPDEDHRAEDDRARDGRDLRDGAADTDGGDRSSTVTDVLDWTGASRQEDDEDGRQTPRGAGVLAAETAREARVARRRRRLLERAEVRRFTRRSRYRRAAWLTAGGLVVVLAASILVAVFSPLMALRTIEVKGASRVDTAEVRQALADQVGRPLARLDFRQIREDLSAFPLIESYVTEEAPPHTLVITITERSPIVAVQRGSGYDLVDPAGIVVQSTPKAPDTLPVADVRSTQLGSSVFRTMTEVVLALPSTVRTQVTEVTASTADDVTLSMRDGSKVVWGNPEQSAQKAELLAALAQDHAARDPQTPVEYDVSAPDNGIVRAQR